MFLEIIFSNEEDTCYAT